MSEGDASVSTDQPKPSKQAFNNYVLFALLFFGAMIVSTTWYGSAANSLHSSAQSWSFIGFLATLGGYLFSLKWDASTILMKR